MGRVIVFTDPHIGLKRKANTTPASQQALNDKQLETLDRILAMDGAKVCGGDIFDQYSNDESVIAAVLSRMSKIDWNIAGNHDVIQAADKTGSLQLIQEALPDGQDKILYADFGDWGYEVKTFGGVTFYGVPHVARQDLFAESLNAALADRKEAEDVAGPTVLLLHANYDSPWDLTETSLNLGRDRAEELLETFDYIVTGHEHNARDDFDGRLIVLGNPFPTTFSELVDKRVLVFEDGKPHFETVWQAEGNFAEFPADAIPEASEAQFIRIKGNVPAAELAAVTSAAVNLWKTCENLLALKLEVTSDMAEAGASNDLSVGRLPERIEAEITDEGMKALWNEIISRVRQSEH